MDTGKASKKKTGGTAVWAITPAGIDLGRTLCLRMPGSVLCLPESETKEIAPGCPVRPYHTLSKAIQEHFRNYSGHIFIFATGIAVRIIAPLLDTKTKDPAVVVMDEKGLFAVSLVSGHLGGANELAEVISTVTGAIPVITTATDVNRLPSIDLLAKKNDLVIETPENIKYVNMKFLKGQAIVVKDPGEHIIGDIPETLIAPHRPASAPDLICTHERAEVSRETLILRPKVLSLGIGCNRHTSEGEILDLVRTVFRDYHLSMLSVKEIGTSEVKRDEPGLIAAAQKLDRDLVFYSRDQLNQIDTIKNPSKMAEKHLGVKSVCEAAAILGAGRGPLIVTKQKTKNVTLAVAIQA